jgi:hypothetical protein
VLQFGPVKIKESFEPPRPALGPPARRGSFHRTFSTDGTTSETVIDTGQDITRPVRFVSSERQGFLTYAEVQALEALYSTGGSFTLITDLLVPLGQAALQYTAFFLPDAPPLFTPAGAPDGNYYYMDIALRIGAGTPIPTP